VACCYSSYVLKLSDFNSVLGVPVTTEPVGLVRIDGKRPDGLTLIPWQGGKPLTWDVTVVSTLADSYLHSTSHSAGSAAETASIRKESKYSSLLNIVGVRRVRGFCPLTSNLGILVYRIDLLSICAYRHCCIAIKRHVTTTQRPATHTLWKYVTYQE